MADDDKTFTQADVDKLMADLNAKHQEDMNALAGKLRAEFKDKEAKAKAEAEKLAKQANMSELEKANAELADWKAKYQEKEDLINLSTQKDETRKFFVYKYKVNPVFIYEKTPQVGLEPTAYRLTAGCSAIELLRIISLIIVLARFRARNLILI